MEINARFCVGQHVVEKGTPDAPENLAPAMTIDTVGVDRGGIVYVCAWWTKDGLRKSLWFREDSIESVCQDTDLPF